MQRFKNILVALNDIVGDDDTLSQAAALAKRNDAHLTVVDIIEGMRSADGFIAEKEKHLHRITAAFQQDGIKIKTVVLTGTPFLEIIRQVIRNNYDLVMMTAEGGGGYMELFFGGTSLHLMRKCPCPVWVTKPGINHGYARIMAAVALDTDTESELNIEIMDLATSLAELNKSDLHVAHAWDVTGNDLDTLKSEFTDEMKDWILRKHESEHQKRLDSLVRRYDLSNLNCEAHLMRGTPEYLLPQLAETSEIDLIVMGTIGRTGIPGFFIGNSAELILRQVRCAVLAVKPEGFVTPVTLQ